jgi:hypothetical protein
MSLQSSNSAEDDRPAKNEGRSFTTGIGSMVASAPDDETAPPARPTFTARSSEPAVAVVPEPTPAADDAAEPGGAVPAEPALGPDDGAHAEPGAEPGAGATTQAGATTDAGPASGVGLVADGGGMRPQPLPSAASLNEPLLSDTAGLRVRWQQVQAGFVDDPQEAVGDAADLIEQTAQALVGALRQRQRQLRVQWDRAAANGVSRAAGDPGTAKAAGVPDTEHLRQLMQRYRALFNQLCRP